MITQDRRWSNTYMKVDQMRDPQGKLRILRGQVASQLWAHRAQRHEARVRANDDIDAGDMAGARSANEKIKAHNVAISALQLVAARLREK